MLLPCRNGARTLKLALRSILAQTFTDFELLLLDDGSTDESTAIAVVEELYRCLDLDEAEFASRQSGSWRS